MTDLDQDISTIAHSTHGNIWLCFGLTSSTELIELSPLLILKHQKQSIVFLALFTTNNIATWLLNQVNNQSLKQPST